MKKKREMKITRNNYEVYFLDYLEGNLDENLVDEFLEFMQQNPDLKEELSMMDTAPILPDNAVFTNKEKLYKEKYDVEETFNQAAIALIEGDISASEKAEFDAYLLKHPEKQKEVQRFQQTKLQPDSSVVFAHKNRLYRRTFGKIIFMWSSRVAAVLVLALAIYFYIDQSGKNIVNQNQVTVVETERTDNNADTETTPPPVESDKKQTAPDEINPKTKSKTPVNEKKEEAVPKPTKSLRETTNGRMEHERIAEARIPVEVPGKIGSLNASVQTSQLQNVALASMNISYPENVRQPDEEVFFAEVVKEKTGLDNFSFRKMTKAGLNLVSNISKDKFSYQTNNEGEITELNYDSRLLAFSIPTNNVPVGGE
jgi:hypothetical protein